jgi:hypothetical protein
VVDAYFGATGARTIAFKTVFAVWLADMSLETVLTAATLDDAVNDKYGENRARKIRVLGTCHKQSLIPLWQSSLALPNHCWRFQRPAVRYDAFFAALARQAISV